MTPTQLPSDAITRREAVKTGTVLLGGIIIGTSGLLGACGREPRAAAPAPDSATPRQLLLSASDQALVESIADTILPDTTASPGAKAAGVGATINLLLTDCVTPAIAVQQGMLEGLAAFRTRCATTYANRSFDALPKADRESLLRSLDVESRAAGPTHWFNHLHALTMTAYFTSQVGTTKALRYVREPGRYTGCVPLQPGQPAWA